MVKTAIPEKYLRDKLEMLFVKVEVLTDQLTSLQADTQYIKSFIELRVEKKARRRAEKEEARLAVERAREAHERRATYENIVWRMGHLPWHFMPFPKCSLSPKELDLVALLSRGKTASDIATIMNIKQSSVSPRICAVNKKLGLTTREELVAFYTDYMQSRRRHRNRRCQILLSWLLWPPEGFMHRRKYKLVWKRRLSRSKTYRHTGYYISPAVFDNLRHFAHEALKLKAKGLSQADIAARLNIKEPTLSSYYAQIRSDIRILAGVKISTDAELISAYKRYVCQKRQTKTKSVKCK